jgi:hypothetical protein
MIIVHDYVVLFMGILQELQNMNRSNTMQEKYMNTHPTKHEYPRVQRKKHDCIAPNDEGQWQIT